MQLVLPGVLGLMCGFFVCSNIVGVIKAVIIVSLWLKQTGLQGAVLRSVMWTIFRLEKLAGPGEAEK